ncbi:MAG: hypothetical protein AAFW76_08045 [Pseudomonadota bacterium]
MPSRQRGLLSAAIEAGREARGQVLRADTNPAWRFQLAGRPVGPLA